MPDDKQTNDKAAQDKKLLDKLDNTVTTLWNSTVTMDEVAAGCSVQKGESLFDRVTKCEAAAKEWEKELDSLKQCLAELKRLLDGYSVKLANHPSHTAQTMFDLATRQHDEMRSGLKTLRGELERWKATLRKVKL